MYTKLVPPSTAHNSLCVVGDYQPAFAPTQGILKLAKSGSPRPSTNKGVASRPLPLPLAYAGFACTPGLRLLWAAAVTFSERLSGCPRRVLPTALQKLLAATLPSLSTPCRRAQASAEPGPAAGISTECPPSCPLLRLLTHCRPARWWAGSGGLTSMPSSLTAAILSSARCSISWNTCAKGGREGDGAGVPKG